MSFRASYTCIGFSTPLRKRLLTQISCRHPCLPAASRCAFRQVQLVAPCLVALACRLRGYPRTQSSVRVSSKSLLVRLVGSLVDCCTLRAVGRRFCVARGPSSCGGRGTSWWALRAGRLLFNIVGRSMSLTGNLAGIFPLFGAPLPSLCRPRGCGVRSRRGGQGSAALCGRL